MDLIRTILPRDLLSGSPALRLDADFALNQTGIEDPVSIETMLRFEAGGPAQPGKAEFYYCEIGHIGRFGDISPMRVTAVEDETDPDLARQLDRIRKKVKAGKIMCLDDWTMLLPKTRTYLGKFAVVSGWEPNLYFTTDLYALVPGPALLARCGDDRGLATCALLLAAKNRGELLPVFVSLSRWGKAYPVLRDDDLKAARIASEILDRATTSHRLAMAARLRDSIKAQETTRREIGQVIREIDAFQYGGATGPLPVAVPPEELGTEGEGDEGTYRPSR